ncbi:hypothetical protein CLOM_g13868 [Closterium sp. NIES-68]|nr:hypothetical protein CLOM_g13868 [Closterium sp. NIES-68]GJP71032.1 hypothetical protein CLOP_g1908 [Closterium sp. NIES-67]
MAESSGASDDALLREFFAEVGAVERDNEVNRVLACFKLNPFEQLNLPFDAKVEDVKKQYRKVSLMIHPDKCKHPQAREAFDVVAKAQEKLLNSDEWGYLTSQFAAAKEDVLRERKRKLKKERQGKPAPDGISKAEEEVTFLASAEFKDLWRLKARELLTANEWRRRKLSKRIKEEEVKIQEEEEETKVKTLKEREHTQKWEETRETRVSSWRDFQKKGNKKAKGELKPPAMRAEDPNKSYVRRPTKKG